MGKFDNNDGTMLTLGAVGMLAALGVASQVRGSLNPRYNDLVHDHLRDKLRPQDRQLIADLKFDLWHGPSAGTSEDYPGWESGLEQLREVMEELPDELWVEVWSDHVFEDQMEVEAAMDQQTGAADVVKVDGNKALLGELAPYL